MEKRRSRREGPRRHRLVFHDYLFGKSPTVVVDLDAIKVGPEWPLLVCHLSLRLLVLWQPRRKGSQEDLRSSHSTAPEEIDLRYSWRQIGCGADVWDAPAWRGGAKDSQTLVSGAFDVVSWHASSVVVTA